MKQLTLLVTTVLFSACVTNTPLKFSSLSQFTAEKLEEPIMPVMPSNPRPALNKGEHYVPTYFFNGEINSDSTQAASLWMMHEIEANEAEAVIIEWNSPGGEVQSGFLFSKMIEVSPVPVVCVVDGEADSMAFYILQSCTVRVMTKRSMLMAHAPSVGGIVHGNEDKWNNIAERLRVMTKAIIAHCAYRMNVSIEKFSKKITGAKEWWFDFKDALNYKAVDLVVNRTKEVQDSYKKNCRPPLNH